MWEAKNKMSDDEEDEEGEDRRDEREEEEAEGPNDSPVSSYALTASLTVLTSLQGG